jgi:hypothetical protein
MTSSLAPLSRFGAHCSAAALLSLFGGCSPDLTLLSDQASFAGAEVGSGGSARASGGSGGRAHAGNKAMGDGGAAGTSTPSSGEAGEAPIGAAGDAGAPPSDGGAGNAGSAGGAPTPPVCVVTGPETCNGKDDNCSGVVDEGCPGGVTTTFQSDLPILGDSSGGTAFTDSCKDGEVLGGVSVAMGAFLSQIRGICRPLALELSTNAEHGYKVTLGASRALAAHPDASPDASTPLECPADETLVGMRIAQQNYPISDIKTVPVITRVWLTCAKLVLTDAAGKLGVTWQGPMELAPASGSMANGTAWLVQAAAPAGLVGSRLLGSAGSWVDRVGFGVSSLNVVMR